MARCEDYPCCGHEQGCCPDFENGRQTNMVCTCGAKVSIRSRSSLCPTCLNKDHPDEDADDESDEMPDDLRREFESDAFDFDPFEGAMDRDFGIED